MAQITSMSFLWKVIPVQAGAIAAAMNYELKNKECQYFWVLDDDTMYAPHALSELVENIEQSKFSMIGLHGAHLKMEKEVSGAGRYKTAGS